MIQCAMFVFLCSVVVCWFCFTIWYLSSCSLVLRLLSMMMVSAWWRAVLRVVGPPTMVVFWFGVWLALVRASSRVVAVVWCVG